MVRTGLFASISVLALLLFSVDAQADWLDGSWEGVVKLDRGSHPFDRGRERSIRIQIAGDVVRVFQYENGKPVELGPGSFHILRTGEMALISGAGSNDVFPHKNQTEVISYAVTWVAEGYLLVEYARVGETHGGEILAEWTATFGEHGEGKLKHTDIRSGGL